MLKKYKITYHFNLQNSDSDILDLATHYWSSINFKCYLENNILTGKRGSVWGNLTSFNMTNLICSLNVNFNKHNNVYTKLLLNGKFQDITEVNLWDFKLELILFYRALNKLPFPDFLSEYIEFRDKAAEEWTVSFTKKGRELSDELKLKIESLVKNDNLPQVDII